MPRAGTNRGKGTCPILCLLSKNSFFRSIINFAHFFSSSGASGLPPYVIITILGASQAESFAPAYSTTHQSNAVYPCSGPTNNKTRRFRHFLVRRLHLRIRGGIPTGNAGFLIKRSCTNLFALRALSGRPRSFSSCVTVSPDL